MPGSFDHKRPVPRGQDSLSYDLAEDPVAIVGASCRLPGAPDLAALWSLLSEGREAIRPLTSDRFPLRNYWHPRHGEPGKFYATRAGLLDDVEGFDAAFFNISAREARQIDPQQRLLLELAWEALEDAGAKPASLRGAGVYVGASGTEYASLRLGDPASGDAYFMPGNTLSIFSNRISYALDLHGPSFTVDTACSSSLVALHLAAEDLRTGRVEAAFVGGVNMLLTPFPFIGFCSAEMLSPTGRCHAFDAAADGYVRAEGGAMLLLKRLSAAQRDGDEIHALLLGTDINSDGHTPGLSFPGMESQAALLSRLYARAGIHPEQLSFVEAHGTGTAAGDPVETGALGAVLGQSRATPLPIGSVKTNLGHLEPASGLAGLLKAMLALQHRELPASLHFETPNPKIPFEELNLSVAAAPRRLGKGRLVAGINNFGFGGTNAHAILASAPPVRPAPVSEAEVTLPPLLLSARSQAALKALAGRFAAAAWDEAALRGLARRRTHQPFRLGVVPGDAAEMRAALAAVAEGTSHPNAVEGKALRNASTVFVFAGNGSQFKGMGRDLLSLNPDFRDGVAAADEALAPHLGWSVREAMNGGDWTLEKASAAQPMLFAMQVGAAWALRAQGVKASAVIGHSVGEIAAAYWAGMLSIEEAARIVVLRSRHQEGAGGGSMAALGCGRDEAMALIAGIAPDLAVAAVNAPNAVTVAGSLDSLQALSEEAAARRLSFQKVDVGYAFHSAAMEPVREPLLADLGNVTWSGPKLTMISTVTGEPAEALDADYWWHNVREPVLFAPAVERLAQEHECLFVEIGPRPVLQHYLRETLRQDELHGRPLPTLKRNPAAEDPFPRIALAIHCAGGDITEAAHFDGPVRFRGLPGTQWQNERHWYTETSETLLSLWKRPPGHPLLITRTDGDVREWHAHLDISVHPWLADHAVGETPVLAAACLIEFAFNAAQAAYPTAAVLELQDFEIARPVILEAAQLRELRLRLEDGLVTIDGRPRLSDGAWVRHAQGRVAVAPVPPGTGVGIEDAGTTLPGELLYAKAAGAGLNYGQRFRRVESVALQDGRAAVAQLSLADPAETAGLLLDPPALDGAFQALIALAATQDTGEHKGAPLPRRFGRIRLDRAAGKASQGSALVTAAGPREIEAEIALLDEDGRAILSAEACWFSRIPVEAPLPVAERSFHEVWYKAPLQPAAWDNERFLALRPVLLAEPQGSEADREAEMLAAAFLQAAASEALSAANATGEGPLAIAARALAGTDLPEAERIWQTLFLDCPDWLAASTLLAWMGERLADAISREEEGTEAGEEAALPSAPLEQLLSGRLAELAANLIADAAIAFAQDWPSGRPVRVLEVQPDRGVLTRKLFPLLAAKLPGLDYTVLEADGERLARLRPVLRAQVPGAALVQQAADRGYDLIVSYASGVRGIVPAQLLGHTPALAAGGALLIAEAAEAPSWSWLRHLSGADISGIEAWAGLPHRLSAAVAGQPSASPFPVALLAAKPAEEEDAAPAAETANTPRLSFAPPADGEGELEAAGRAILALTDEAISAAEAGEMLAIVTRGAETDPVEAARAALARVLANEYPALACRRIELDPGLPEDVASAKLAEELASGSAEAEVRWSAEGRAVRRLREGLPSPAEEAAPVPRRLVQKVPGPLNRLSWMETPGQALGPREVAIDVRATGLNFRDVLQALGMLPDEALLDGFAGATLGMECAGLVADVGEAVTEFAPGDRVMAFASAAHATRVVTDAEGLLRLPENISFADGATIPVAFLTVLYALETLAALRPGETILIHGAAGGVGLAAVQYAQHVGARIIATAGSEAKRAVLRNLGVGMVLNSRSLAFADEIEQVAGGKGIDVVLNSLAGEAMERSLALLKPFGRFIELGKRDFFANTRVGLRPLRRNVTYHGVDVDALLRHRPDVVRSLVARLGQLLEDGALRPLPHTDLPFAEAAEAFSLMRASGHIGKVVLTSGALPASPHFALRGDTTIVVSGGTAGFGAAAAHWLVGEGARHLLLLSRRGAETPGAEALRDSLLRAGAGTVEFAACDVADSADLNAVLTEARAARPIGGVVHAATLLADGLLSALTPEQVETALRAKLGGALALDALTRGDELELFLIFSSATVTLGAPGQGAYVAANAAVEALMARRQAAGLPGCAVRWGPIRDTGLLARSEAVREALSRRLGARAMPAADALGALPALLASGEAAPVLAEVNWAAAASLPVLATPLFTAVARKPEDDGEGSDVAALLAGKSEAERCEILGDLILGELVRIMQADRSAISLDTPLADLGMDSLTAVELVLGLERRLAISLPNFAWQEMTVQRIASQISRLMQTGAAAPSVPAEAGAVATRHLTEAEEAALSQDVREAAISEPAR